MGHRVSANLFRVGLSRSWNSHWFAKSEYTYLLSLDYRIRDFIDFIFYNLKWPTSELQIRRFLSRCVILELLISISDDQLVYFLDFTKFLGNLSITDNIDSFKFNGLLFEYNYVLFNFAYNILGKSLFFLLLRQHKLNINYDKSLFLSLYKNLFYVSNSSLEQDHDLQSNINYNIYLLKKKKIFVKAKFLNAISKEQFRKFNLNKDSSKYFLVDLLSLFSYTSNGKLYINKYLKYLLYLNDLIRVRSFRKRMSSKIHKLLFHFINSQQDGINLFAIRKIYFRYFEQINKTIKYLIHKYSKYNPYILLSSYSQIKKFINEASSTFINNTQGRRFLNSNLQHIDMNNLVVFIQYIIYLYRSLPVERFNIFTVLLFTYSMSKLIKEIFANSSLKSLDELVKFPISNSQPIFEVFSKHQQLYLVNYMCKNKSNLFNSTSFNKSNGLNLNAQLSLILNNFPLLLWQKWKTIIKLKSIHSSRLGTVVNKDIYKLITRQKENKPKQIVQKNREKQNMANLDSIKKRKFFAAFPNFSANNLQDQVINGKSFRFNTFNKSKRMHIVNDTRFLRSNRLHFANSIISGIKKLKNKGFNTVRFNCFRRLIYPSLLKSIHSFNGGFRLFNYDTIAVYVDIITYFIRMYYFNNNFATRSKLLSLSNKVELNDVLFFYNATSVQYYYTRISFFFDSLWYSNIGSSYITKLVLLYRYNKYYLKSPFVAIYQNLYNIFIFRKFFNFFNCLRLESTISISIKFFRFFKKLFFDIKKKFLKKSILLFILFIYSYLNLRFSRVQLFIRSLLIIFTRNEISIEQFSVLRRSSIYIFLYYFYSHLKLCIFILRILQLYVMFSINVLSVKTNYLIDYLRMFISNSHYDYKYILRIDVIKYKKIYLYLRRMYNIQLDVAASLQRYVSTIDIPIITPQSYSLFMKLIPDFICSPYYVIDRSIVLYDIDSIDGTQLPDITVPLNRITSTIDYPILYSKQWKQILFKRRPYFFRYVVDKLIYYLDDIRRDSVPVQSLQFFSTLIEYNLSTYLKNVVIFMPIYYLSTRVPFYQAKLICLYVSYELEKGIPYFLVLKQIMTHNRLRHTKKYKYFPIKNLNTILGQKIFTTDDRFLQLTNFEFIVKYQREWQSKTVFKYFIFRNFYSLGTVRRFKHKLGLRISCSGRMYRRQTRSHTMWFVEGSLPLRSFEKYIEFYSSFAITNLGTVGVKVWSFLAQIPILS